MLAFITAAFFISIWREPNNEEIRRIFEFGSERRAQSLVLSVERKNQLLRVTISLRLLSDFPPPVHESSDSGK